MFFIEITVLTVGGKISLTFVHFQSNNCAAIKVTLLESFHREESCYPLFEFNPRTTVPGTIPAHILNAFK